MSSNHSDPIVPHVLSVADQRHPWRLAPLERLATTYHTPTTVRVETQHLASQQTRHQHQVHCLPDDAAWERAQACRAAYQSALDALAAGLRALGGYASRLAEAGGIKAAPNPLCPTVIAASDPDRSDSGYWFNNPVPRIDRDTITSHTPKMLHIERDGRPWLTSHQRDHFVCPDDAAWERITALHGAVQAAADRWAALLAELGTYSEALADGRYDVDAFDAKPQRREEPRREDSKNLCGFAALRQKEEPMATIAAPLPPIKMGTPLKLSTNVALADSPSIRQDSAAGGILPAGLEERARRYVAARRRSGDALLEAVAELAAARAEAEHGEWGIFLQAIGLAESAARAQIRIHEAALADSAFAERIRTGWLSEATARELLPAPPEIRAGILAREEPPTKAEIRAAKREPAPVLEQPNFSDVAPDGLPPLNPPGWAELKAAGWRLDSRTLDGRYRVFPPGYGHAAEYLTAAEIAERAAVAPARTPVPPQDEDATAKRDPHAADPQEPQRRGLTPEQRAANAWYQSVEDANIAINDALDAYDRAAVIRAALSLASAAAGARLEDMAGELDDACYEALAAYRRDRRAAGEDAT